MFHILVVEDDKNLRRLMAAYLEQEGYEVYHAEDGEAALTVLDSTHIDLMISDIMMPNIDGYELVEELRAAGFTIPILMVTAKETFEDKKKGFLAGTDDYMVKPIDMEEMLLRVAALLRRANIANEHKLQIGDDILLDYDSLTVHAHGRLYELPKRNFIFYSSCSPIQKKFSPASSLWTKYGGWMPKQTNVQ